MALILLLYLGAGRNKRNYAKLQLNKSELFSCQKINDENISNADTLEQELSRCVGVRDTSLVKIFESKIEIDYFTKNKERKLDETINNIKSLSNHSCDSNVVDPTIVKLWNAKKADS